MKFFALALVAGLSLAVPVFGDPPREPRLITVSGHAVIEAAPDRAVLSMAVETDGKEAGAVASENARRSEAVAAALRKLIGDGDRVTTSGYSLHPTYTQPHPGEVHEPKIAGYRALNQVVVETAAIAAVGKLIDAAVAAGANRVNDLQFTLADRSPQLRVALAQASKQARAQAEAIAGALGVTLARVAWATTGAQPIVQPRQMDMMRMKASFASAPETPISAGDVSVHAEVQVAYEIE